MSSAHNPKRTDTNMIPAQTGGQDDVESWMTDGERKKKEKKKYVADDFRDKQINYMTAVLFWFILICVLLAVGAGVLRLISEIL